MFTDGWIVGRTDGQRHAIIHPFFSKGGYKKQTVRPRSDTVVFKV